MVAHNSVSSSPKGSNAFLGLPPAPGTQAVQRRTHRQNSHTHKIKLKNIKITEAEANYRF